MGSETWYRGEAAGGNVSTPGGGAIHDLGEGVYYTSDREIAKQYADTRAKSDPASSRAYRVQIDRARLRVLDLTQDARWNNFLRSKPAGSLTVEQLIRMANENYGRFFNTFIAQHKIDLKQYNAVIGPEFVRGGKQLCILLKNGKQTPLHTQLRASFQLYYQGGKEVTPRPATAPNTVNFIPPSSVKILRPASGLRQAAGNQAAAAMIGVALGGAALWLGGKGIERKIRKELETTHAAAINSILARNQGVLLIIRLMEWDMPNDIGMRSKSFLSLHVHSGNTQQAALQSWHAQHQLLPGSPNGWHTLTQYAWIPPQGN